MARVAERDRQRIEAAFTKVRASAEKVAGGDDSAKDRSYEEIFALNNEVGRVGRQRPELMPKMKELQLCVNMITVGIKQSRTGDIREGLSAAREAIASMKNEIGSAP